MKDSSSRENRKAVRVPVRLTVVLKETTFDGSLYFFSKNLSVNGIFLESDMLLQENVIVHIEFLLPADDSHEAEQVKAVGRVVRVEDRRELGVVPGLGVEFLELEPHCSEALERFIT